MGDERSDEQMFETMADKMTEIDIPEEVRSLDLQLPNLGSSEILRHSFFIFRRGGKEGKRPPILDGSFSVVSAPIKVIDQKFMFEALTEIETTHIKMSFEISV